MSGKISVDYNIEYKSIYGNNLPNTYKDSTIRDNIKNEKQEAAVMLNLAKELEKNIEDAQRATTSMRGFSLDIKGWFV